MKKILFTSISCLLFFMGNISGQLLQNGSFENIVDCTDANPFFNGLVLGDWYSGSGTPHVVCGEDAFEGENYTYMYARHNDAQAPDPFGESIFYDFEFIEGEEYTLRFAWRNEAPINGSSQTHPSLYIKLANGLQNTTGIPNNISDVYPFDVTCPNNESQCIFNQPIGDAATNWTYIESGISFTANANYDHLLIYSAFSPVLPSKKKQAVHVDNFSLEGPSTTVDCDTIADFEIEGLCRFGDQLEITLNAVNTASNFHLWRIFLVPEDQICTPDATGDLIFQSSSTTANPTFLLSENHPYESLINRCLVVKHYTNSSDCEGLPSTTEAIIVPYAPAIDADFNTSFDLSGDPGEYVYTALPFIFPTNHNWIVEQSENPDGPWTPFAEMGGLNVSEITVLQPYDFWYRVCHTIRRANGEVCVRDSVCNYIFYDKVFENNDGLGGNPGGGSGGGGSSGDEIGGGNLISTNVPPSIIRTYPSPANTEVKIAILNELFMKQGALLELRNVSGQIVQEKSLPPYTSNEYLDVSTLPNGLYLLQLTNEHGLSTVQKIIITR